MNVPEVEAVAPDGKPVVVAARGLQKVYNTAGHSVRALAGVDLDVRAGEFCAIMGASGSGKSTLLYLVGGLTRPSGGSVVVEGHNLAEMSDRRRTLFRRRRLGIVFQEYNLLPTLTARENVALPHLLEGRAWHRSLAGAGTRQAQRPDATAGAEPGRCTSAYDYDRRLDELLDVVHLGDRAGHRPDALSGGEQQRVAIARALLNDPAIVLADEPTGNLDSRQSAEIWALLRRIACEQGKTILMVTHEAQGAAYADRVVILKDGRVIGYLEPKGSCDAALVATRYQELAG